MQVKDGRVAARSTTAQLRRADHRQRPGRARAGRRAAGRAARVGSRATVTCAAPRPLPRSRSAARRCCCARAGWSRATTSTCTPAPPWASTATPAGCCWSPSTAGRTSAAASPWSSSRGCCSGSAPSRRSTSTAAAPRRWRGSAATAETCGCSTPPPTARSAQIPDGIAVLVDRLVARFTRAELESFRDAEVPDLLGPGCRLLFVGINPGLWTAATQTHFAHPANRFYPALLRAGILERRDRPRRRDDRRRPRPPRRARHRHHQPGPPGDRAGRRALRRRAARGRRRRSPSWSRGCGRAWWRSPGSPPTGPRSAYARAAPGRQPEPLAGAELWVVPNPSGLNAHETVASLADGVRRGGARGRGPRLSRSGARGNFWYLPSTVSPSSTSEPARPVGLGVDPDLLARRDDDVLVEDRVAHDGARADPHAVEQHAVGHLGAASRPGPSGESTDRSTVPPLMTPPGREHRLADRGRAARPRPAPPSPAAAGRRRCRSATRSCRG